ncbi:MAG TPA: PAS domain S-box protein, partial [Acidimicrobiales bacterium]|nr:PAS domain S-box protein [Acidimicrobiales bacterium]
MRTPSLRTRIVVAGVATVAGLLVGLNVLLYVAIRSSLVDNVDDRLRADAMTVRSLSTEAAPDRLRARLTALGIQATVRLPDGTTVKSPSTGPTDHGSVRREVRLPGGGSAVVSRSLADVDHPLSRLLRLQLVVSPLLIALAFLFLRLISEIALRPLEHIAAAARRTTEGHMGQRLRPDRPDTRLGQVAAAYDGMLDALEAAVVEARESEARARTVEERYRRIIDTAQEAFLSADEDGTIIEWNAEAERTFGWSKDEAIGRKVADLLIPAEDRAAHHAEVRRYLKTGHASFLDGRVNRPLLRKDGRRIPVGSLVWATRQRGSVILIGLAWDMTRRLKEEEALSQLAAVVSSTDEAMFSVNRSGTVLTWNGGAERVYGWPADEVVGRSIFQVFADDGRADIERWLDDLERQPMAERLQARHRRRSGKRIDVALTLSPMFEANGRLSGGAAIARDVTAERRVAARLEGSLEALEQALYDAQSSEATLRRFLDDAAHQMRAPITGIRACAETLARGCGPDDQERLSAAIVREAARASRLMTSLLQLARLDHGRKLAPAPCDVLALCRHEAARLARVAPQIDVVVVDAGDAPVGRPELDAEAVGEIVANLLDNARRHASARVVIAVRAAQGVVELRFFDDGPGLPAGAAETVFERFVSLDGRGGCGLGLPIARGLARAHGGDLTYEAKAFVLRL